MLISKIAKFFFDFRGKKKIRYKINSKFVKTNNIAEINGAKLRNTATKQKIKHLIISKIAQYCYNIL